MTPESTDMLVDQSCERPRRRRAGPGRPRLNAHERRTVHVTLTLTETEADAARERAAAVGLRLRPYLRQAALGDPVGGDPAVQATDTTGSSERGGAGLRPAPTLSAGAVAAERLALLRRIAGDLGKVGSNLNQLAHRANEARVADNNVGAVLAGQADALAKALADWRRTLREIQQWPGLRVTLPREPAGTTDASAEGKR